MLQCEGQSRAQCGLVFRCNADVGDRQLDAVFLEARQPRPGCCRNELAVDPEVGVTLGRGPFREVGVIPLAIDHQGGQQADAVIAILRHDARGDLVDALRLDRNIAIRAVLGAEFDVEQAEEMINFSQRGHRAAPTAAAGALLNGHGRRNAVNRIDVGARCCLHELACIGI